MTTLLQTKAPAPPVYLPNDLRPSLMGLSREELAEILKNKRELWTQLHPGEKHPGNVILQVDRRVQALVVKSVFNTAAQAGYPAVSFMVGKMAKD